VVLVVGALGVELVELVEVVEALVEPVHAWEVEVHTWGHKA
jgi:hypothetical protein